MVGVEQIMDQLRHFNATEYMSQLYFESSGVTLHEITSYTVVIRNILEEEY